MTRIAPALGQNPTEGDLRAFVPENRLVCLALEAVQAHQSEAIPGSDRDGRRHSGAMLLTLLTYCYAVGIYGSQDIEVRAKNDRTVRYLCANNVPDWNSIRAFRRRNRLLVQGCLASLLSLARAWEKSNPQDSG